MSVAFQEAGGGGEIRQRLDNPSMVVDLVHLAAHWHRQTVQWRLPGLAALARDPALVGRIRGAFGQRLIQAASAEAIAGRPCNFDPPSAFEAVWRKQGRLAPGYEHSAPFVIGIDPHAGALHVSLTVFGFATEWMPAIVETMTCALQHDVDWAGETRLFVPDICIAGRSFYAQDGIDIAAEPAMAMALDFVSPLALTGADPRIKPASLIIGLARRIAALARWQDLLLSDPAIDALCAGARLLSYDFEDFQEVRWRRGSKRQDRWIPMHGYLCRLIISGENAVPPDLDLLIRLGATCHIGADVAFGCGRYEISVAA